MSLVKILIESRKDMFTSKFSNKFSSEQLQQILDTTDVIPNQGKYLNFIGTVVNPRNFQDDLSIVTKLLKKFSILGPNLVKKDINQYQSIKELKEVLLSYENRIRREVKKVEGADIIYEDDSFVMVHPKTYEASCHYGAGTKWCTTSSSNTFKSYQNEKKLFYVINKKKPSSDRFYKIAILYNFDGNQTFYDAPDNMFKPELAFTERSLTKLLSAIESYVKTEYEEEYSKYEEKRKEEIEKEKQRRREEQIRMANIRVQQQERRETQQWNLDENPDDEEALKANALFGYLVSIGNITPLTSEDIQRRVYLQSELDRKMEIYDNTENANEDTDLVSEISVIEDEILEIDQKEDVYVLIPSEYGSWGLTTFSYFNEEWVADSEDNFEKASIDAIDSLLDDIGYQGFNTSFVANYIDENDIRRYIREFFSEDVYENPEAYLEDSDRELSSNQLTTIKNLESEWESLNEKEAETEDEIEIQEIIERIDEIKDEIQEINDNPDGDFNEDKIDDVINDMVNYNNRNIESFVMNYIGIPYSEFIIQFINKDDFIEGVIETDGFGSALNTYDGDYYTYYLRDNTYCIARFN